MAGTDFTLNFPVNTPGIEKLAQINAAIATAAQRVNLSVGDFRLWTLSVEGAVEAGEQLQKAILNTVTIFGQTTPALKAFQAELRGISGGFNDVVQQAGNAADQVDKHAKRVEAALGRAGGRVAGVVLGRAIGLPGSGFIGSQLAGSLGAGYGTLEFGATAFAIRQIVGQITEVTKYAQEQQNLAKEIGMTAQQVQLFGRVAEVTGTQASAMFTVINKLNDGMAKGGMEARNIGRALTAIGLDTNVAFAAPEKQLSMVLGALSKISDESERARLIVNLFGEEGRKLLPLVDSFERISKAVQGSGIIIGKEATESLVRYREEAKLMVQALEALRNKAAPPILIPITYLLKVITQITQDVTGGRASAPAVSGSVSTGATVAEMVLAASIPGVGAIPGLLGFLGSQTETKGKGFLGLPILGPKVGYLPKGPQSSNEALIKDINETWEMNRKKKLVEDIEVARWTGLDEVGRLQRELQIVKQDIDKFDTRSEAAMIGGKPNLERKTPQAMKELNERRVSLENQLAAAEKRRGLLRAAQERAVELRKRSEEEAFSDVMRGIGPAGAYKVEINKIQQEMEDDVRKYPSQKYSIMQSYGIRFLAAEQREKERRQKEIESLAESGGRLTTTINKGETAEAEKKIRLGREETEGQGFYNPVTPGIIMRGQRELMTAPLPPGYRTLREEQREIQFFRHRGLEQVDIQRMMGDIGGFEAAQKNYDVRIKTAQMEVDLADRKIKQASTLEKLQEAQQLREEAIDRQKEENQQAELDRQRQIAELISNQMREFSGGFAGIIMGAQRGGGRGASQALMGFLENQEGRILENVGNIIWKGGTNKVFQGIGKVLGPTLSRGTIFEVGLKPEEKLGIAGDKLKDSARDLSNAAVTLARSGGATVGTTGELMPGLMYPLPGQFSGTALSTIGAITGLAGAASGFGSGASTASQIAAATSVASTVSQILGGAKYMGAGWWNAVFHGVDPNDPFKDPGSLSTKERIGAAAGSIGAGFGAYSGIRTATRGGAKNVTGGVGAALLSVAPFTGPAAPFVAGAGAALVITSSLLPNNLKGRQEEIAKRIFTEQYLPPQAQDITEAFGGYSDVDMYGNVRQSRFSPYEVTSNSYLDVPRRIVVPGRTQGQFGGPTGDPSGLNLQNPVNPAPDPQGPTGGGGDTYNIYAIDHKSFSDYLMRNPGAVVDSFHLGIRQDDSGVVNTLAQQMGRR